MFGYDEAAVVKLSLPCGPRLSGSSAGAGKEVGRAVGVAARAVGRAVVAMGRVARGEAAHGVAVERWEGRAVAVRAASRVVAVTVARTTRIAR